LIQNMQSVYHMGFVYVVCSFPCNLAGVHHGRTKR
jgi:hypothetical protein